MEAPGSIFNTVHIPLPPQKKRKEGLEERKEREGQEGRRDKKVEGKL